MKMDDVGVVELPLNSTPKPFGWKPLNQGFSPTENTFHPRSCMEVLEVANLWQQMGWNDRLGVFWGRPMATSKGGIYIPKKTNGCN